MYRFFIPGIPPHLSPFVRRKGFAFILLLLGLFLTVGEARGEFAPDAHQVRPLLVGTEVPDLTLATVDGKTFDLRAEAKIKPFVLVFYRGHW